MTLSRYDESRALEQRFDASTVTAAVAAELGKEWRAVNPYRERIDAAREETDRTELTQWARGRHNIVHEDGPSVHVALNSYDKKLTFCGNFPAVPGKGPNDDFGPSFQIRQRIQTSVDRPAKAIAGEIRRRLLPVYLEQYAAACRQRDAAALAAAQSAELCAELERILGLKHRGEGRHNGHRAPGDDYIIDLGAVLGEGYGDVSIYAGGSARFELRSLSADAAVVIATALAGLRK